MKKSCLFIVLALLIASMGTSRSHGEGTRFSIKAEAEFKLNKHEIAGHYTARYNGSKAIERYIKLSCKVKQKSSYYISSFTEYTGCPLRKPIYSTETEISRVAINGLNLELSTAALTEGFMIIPLPNEMKVRRGDSIEVDYKVHILSMDKDTYLGDDWLPLIYTAEDENFVFAPFDFSIEFTLPKGYSYLSSGKIVGEEVGDETATYTIRDENIPLSVILLSPRLKLLKKSEHPFKHSIWAIGCSLQMERIELIEEQIDEYYKLLGRPVSDGGELSICFININKNILGKMMGNFIAINASYLNSALSTLFGGSTTIAHELMHYWWIGRFYGPLSENDITFHECFIDHLLSFYHSRIKETDSPRAVKLLSGILKERSESNFLQVARGGYSFSVLPDSTMKDTPFLEKSSKGITILNSLSKLYGRKKWEKKIISYLDLIRNKGAITFENFCTANEDIAPYVRSLFKEDRDFDYSVRNVRNENLEGGMARTTIELENEGGIVAPAPVKVVFEDGSTKVDTVVIRGGAAELSLVQGSRAKEVSIDPDCILPDAHPRNNDYPEKPSFSLLSRHLIGNSRRSPWSIDIVPLNMIVPFYSEEIGFELFKQILRIGGEKRSFGAYEGGAKTTGLSFDLGYNFRAEEPVWHAELNAPLLQNGRFNSWAVADMDKSPVYKTAMLSFSGGHAANPFYHPVQSFSVELVYTELLRPEFKDQTWPTGKELLIQGRYDYMNINTLFFPYSGYRFSIRASKAIGTDWSEWDYERLKSKLELYKTLPTISVLALRLHGAHIFGNAPIQEMLDLDRDALMGTFELYEKTGQSILSANAELRLKEAFSSQLLEPFLFLRNAWLKPYGSSKLDGYFEAGIGFRFMDNSPISVSLDLTLLRKVKDEPAKGLVGAQIKLGRPFDYSPIRASKH